MLALLRWLVDPTTWGPLSFGGVSLLLASLAASLHVLLHKREAASAVAWMGLVWLAPGVGPAAYLFLGINRVERKAARLLGRRRLLPDPRALPSAPVPDALAPLAWAVGRVTGQPLLAGNAVTPLRNGDAAFPAMLAAIDGARASVSLLTYILDDDPHGRRFVDALVAAHRRGVAVRVLLDGIGARRAWGTVRELRRAGVPTEVFLWSWAPWKMALVNLRNHRKLLVVDGAIGFTGGMNLGEDVVHVGGTGATCDLHFRVEGPVVAQLQEQFAVDWGFAADEALEGAAWFPSLGPVGPSAARVIPDGPDEDALKLADVLFQAIGVARRSILVLTPYFLPPEPLHAALRAAAQRGVDVRVILPEHNVPAFMNRATFADVERLLEAGVAIALRPGPFEHTKLMIVDDAWVLLGSGNWDPRSLRLNFELNVEVVDPALAHAAKAAVADVLISARPLTLEAIRARGTARRLVDAGIRLLKPYL